MGAPVAGSDSSTANSMNDPGNRREEVDNSPYDPSGPRGGVSVQGAEAEFAELRKSLSRASRASRSKQTHEDPEKASDSADDGLFDLESVLRGDIAREEQAGIKPKHIGAYWNNLTVSGVASSSNFIFTFPLAMLLQLDVISPVRNLLGLTKKPAETKILDNFSGLCKPGEMVLVLGRPGSGCSTFLKTIANQRGGFTGVEGDVRYGRFTAEEFQQYRGEAVYNQEDDIHHATLTVGQTLDFALDTKVPGKLPAGLTKHDFKTNVVTTLLKMFNIEHTRNTVVGDAHVRGVSGGERKRVSIAEMMITNACICSWDNSTRGLDASTALDFAKSLRVMTNLYKCTTFVSLYQASENIYNVFDKVLVIDSGREAYFGPIETARQYFEGLGFAPRPRQTTPDYVTGCTDEFEREYAPGFSKENAPHSPETLAEAFSKSDVKKGLDREMEEYLQNLNTESAKFQDFQVAVAESKRSSPSHSVYTAGFHIQIWALMKRQFLLKMQDTFSLYFSWFRAIVMALVLGTLYYDLGSTSADAFSRGGVLFISLLFIAFQTFSELASTMTGRGIMDKHRAYTFHRPSALWLAQIIVDQAFSASQIFVFSLIVYFMTNLARDAGAFFIFYLVLVIASIAMTLYFRIVGCMSPDFDYAMKFTVLTLSALIITSGFLIAYPAQHKWMRWIFWINPVGLVFASMMINEFMRINLTCDGSSLIPNGNGYTEIVNQVCTLPGSVAGSTTVRGIDYIEASFGMSKSDLWRNIGIVLAIIVLFLFLNVTLGEMVNHGGPGGGAKVFDKPNQEREALNTALKEKLEARRANPSAEQTAELSFQSEAVLTWENLNYDVPVPEGTRRLLNNIHGYVRPGELTALMGASGAGKTTLLDVLAARKNIGVITGDVLVDGAKPGLEFQRSTSYAEQIDLHDPTQTVREALRFSADLRQPFETPQAEKYAYVEEIISLLEMEHIADAMIGFGDFGLTVEQRKRVTIGVELAAKPDLLLFLDEPTSGLDSQSAFNIVRFLKKLASAGQAILCTIHQPNASLFENFDRLLLLQRGGRTVYFGPIGKDAHVLRGYLHDHGADAAPTENVAEFMLEAIGAGSRPRVGPTDWADIWDNSPEFAHVKETITELKREGAARSTNSTKGPDQEYASPFGHQLKVVLNRMNISFWRSPNYLVTRILNHIFVGVIAGLAYLNLDNSRTSLQNQVFVMFQVTVLPALIITQVEVMYHVKRALFFREASSKMYNSIVFAMSIVIAEIPYTVLCAVVFYIPIYYMPGFEGGSSRAGYQFLMILITEFFSITLGQMLGSLTPSPFISAQFDPLIMLILSLFCGVTISSSQMPDFWSSWMYELDPFTRLIGGMVTTALHGQKVECTNSELNFFNAPNGQTCGSYMDNFFAAGGAGYIANPNSTECGYCAYAVGDQFYEPLDLSFDNRWRDMGIFLAFVGSNLIILFLGSRFINYNRR
ncbi:ABC transporter G family member 11 [Ceratocystis platani]|uniref:ABC transporter G family member 11 n=1 Tax=Ceratocystis fimbriata f. sp. platani TaxID=88771 RepID=A0A0F8CU66_CERFI|nr:ABC transporter G family member 11 [Ceratocystis platani]